MDDVQNVSHGRDVGLLDLRQAARLVGVGYEGFRRWAVARPPEGFPPFVMIGNRYYLRRVQLIGWLEGKAFTQETVRSEERSQNSPVRGRGRPPNQQRV